MNISQTARDAAERWHRFANDYPELAERALPEFIQSAMDTAQECQQPRFVVKTTPGKWNSALMCCQPETKWVFRDPHQYIQ